jgi:hypothetical protein
MLVARRALARRAGKGGAPPAAKTPRRQRLEAVSLFGKKLIETEEDAQARVEAKRARTAALHKELATPYWREQHEILRGAKAKLAAMPAQGDPVDHISGSQGPTLTPPAEAQSFPVLACHDIAEAMNPVELPAFFGAAPCVVCVAFREFAAAHKARWLAALDDVGDAQAGPGKKAKASATASEPRPESEADSAAEEHEPPATRGRVFFFFFFFFFFFLTLGLNILAFFIYKKNSRLLHHHCHPFQIAAADL